MKDFREFLLAAGKAKLAVAFDIKSKPGLSVDVALEGPGISLDKKSIKNIAAQEHRSVIELVQSAAFPRTEPELSKLTSLQGLANDFKWEVEDASPDSVVGVLFFAARQIGVDFPDDVLEQWVEVVADWEVNGVVDEPSRSWCALASALSHTLLGSDNPSGFERNSFPLAWEAAMKFATEALLAGWDPSDIPQDASGTYLARARAALEEEKARYERWVFAAERFQLSLPMIGSNRRRLVDAIIKHETEFSGAMKVYARNDRENSFLGRGFTVLILVRSDLKNVDAGNWLTVSLDTRQNVHLLDLWYELERQETLAWKAWEMDRPARRERDQPSRVLLGIPKEDQPYHEHWYLSPDHSLLASPHVQSCEFAETGELRSFPSLLDEQSVLTAVFQIFNPLEQLKVTDLADGQEKNLSDVLEITTKSKKRILGAYWPSEQALPHPSSGVPMFGLDPVVARVMGARTQGASSDFSITELPDLEEFDLYPFGNGIGLVSDGGVFLIDAGRRTTAFLAAARDMIIDLADVALRLDDIQVEVAQRAEDQAAELTKRASIRNSLDHQRFCTQLHAELIRIRASLDQPLATKYAGLQKLSDGISDRWNIRERSKELAAEIESLQQNGKAADELRTFHLGRVAGGFGIAIVFADSLATRVTQVFSEFSEPDFFLTKPQIEVICFVALLMLSIPVLMMIEKVFRSRIGKRD